MDVPYFFVLEIKGEGDIVFDFTPFKVRRKASRYKRLLEKLYIYPYPFEMSGENYFLVDYLKFRQVKGTAVISSELDRPEEAQKAFRYLYQFYRLSEKIQEEGKVRANVPLKFFQNPLQLMDENPNAKWEDAYAFIKDLLAYQLTYRKTYDDFWSYIEDLETNKKALSETELDLAIYTAAKLEALQQHMVYKISKNVIVIRKWMQTLKDEGLWDELKNDVKAFYTQLTQNEETMKAEARKIKHEDFDIALKMMRTEMKHYMAREGKRNEEVLRYPKKVN